MSDAVNTEKFVPQDLPRAYRDASNYVCGYLEEFPERFSREKYGIYYQRNAKKPDKIARPPPELRSGPAGALVLLPTVAGGEGLYHIIGVERFTPEGIALIKLAMQNLERTVFLAREVAEAKEASTKLRGQLQARLIRELQERKQRAKARSSRQQGQDDDDDNDSTDSDRADHRKPPPPARAFPEVKRSAPRNSSRPRAPPSEQKLTLMRFLYQKAVKPLMEHLYSSDWKQRMCNMGKPAEEANWRLQYQEAKTQQQQQEQEPPPEQDQLMAQDANQQQEGQQLQDEGCEGQQQRSGLSRCGCGGSCQEARNKLGFPSSIPLAREAWYSAPSQDKVVKWVRSCRLLQVEGGHAKVATAAQEFLQRWDRLQDGAEAAAANAKAARAAALATAGRKRAAAAKARQAALANQNQSAAAAGEAVQAEEAASDPASCQPVAKDSKRWDRAPAGHGIVGVPAAEGKGSGAAEHKGNRGNDEQPNFSLGKGRASGCMGPKEKSCGSRPAAKISRIKQQQRQRSKLPEYIPPVSYSPGVPKGRRKARPLRGQSAARGDAQQMFAAFGHIVGHNTRITAAGAPEEVPSPPAAAAAGVKEVPPQPTAAAAGVIGTRRKRAPDALDGLEALAAAAAEQMPPAMIQPQQKPAPSQQRRRKRQRQEVPEWAADGDCGGAATSFIPVSQQQVTAATAIMRKEKKRGATHALLAAMGRTSTGGAATTGNGDCFFNAEQQYHAMQRQSTYPYHPSRQQLRDWEKGHEQQRQGLADLISDNQDVRQLVTQLEQLLPQQQKGLHSTERRSISKRMGELMAANHNLSPAHAYAEVIKVPCSTGQGEGFWADDTAVRLMAIKEGRPILMVIPAPDNEAKILVFPPSTAEPSLSAYYTPYGEYTYIPSVAYDPTAIVVCYNGSSHFWVTWLREPQEIGAESQMEMLEAYKQAGDMTSDFSVLAMKPVALGSATATAV